MNNKFACFKATTSMIGAIILTISLVLAAVAGNAFAAVSGPCANCHTMHNSQDGLTVANSGTSASLLVEDCVGCHSSTNPNTAIDPITGAPIVYSTSGAPTFGPDGDGLAGGNFYWVAQGDDAKGHNVFASNPDDNLSAAPGAMISACGGAESCHDELHSQGNFTGFAGIRQGCTKCHMMGTEYPKGYHHKDDTGPIIDTAAEGWFRFLAGHMSGAGHGVTGIEDDDWLATSSASDHNEYLGISGTKTVSGGFGFIGNTITAYCAGCHNNFHIESSGGKWIRHPSDAVIPNSSEYAEAYGAVGGVGTYDPTVPVARPTLTAVSANVNVGTDMVMCLSCHKAHGSPYDDMLRWDYDEMIAGNPAKTGGCFSCHTAKND